MISYEIDRTLGYIFVLTALLVALVYYVGLKSDVGAVTSGIEGIINVLTGRPAAGGAFQAYPGGGGK